MVSLSGVTLAALVEDDEGQADLAATFEGRTLGQRCQGGVKVRSSAGRVAAEVAHAALVEDDEALADLGAAC